ncbi:MAG: hypothetical protein WDN48_03735 [Pseudolabrys sp.]
MRPLSDGIRAVGIEARNVSTRDILLALRLNESAFEADLPLSASVRADILPDGTPQVVQGQLIADAGTIVDHNNDSMRIAIDHADFRFNWDARRGSLVVPFQIKSGGNQFTMQATLEASAGQSGWALNVTRGDPVIDPVILGGAGDEEGISINRMAIRARIDLTKKRVDLDQGDFSRIDTRPDHNVGVAVTGSLDYSGTEPRLAFGVAGTPHADQRHEAAVADVRRGRRARLGRGAHFRRHRRARGGGRHAPLQTFKHGGPPTPKTACRSTSKPPAPRCGRSTTCRRSATAI